MAQIIVILLLIGVAVVAIKVAVVLLFLVGLIFRTKETLALLVTLGALALFRNYPLACLIIGGVATVLAVARVGSRKDDRAPTPRLPDKPES